MYTNAQGLPVANEFHFDGWVLSYHRLQAFMAMHVFDGGEYTFTYARFSRTRRAGILTAFDYVQAR
jgi:hypothetical protein